MADLPAPMPVSLMGNAVSSRAAWERAAGAVLTRLGREPDPSGLNRITLDGIVVPALAPPSAASSDPGRPPFGRGTPAALTRSGWDIRSHIADPDPDQATADLLDDLANGASSVLITLGSNGTRVDDLPAVLDDVYLDLAPVVVRASGEMTGRQAAWALADVLAHRDRPHPATNLGLDPVADALRSGSSPALADLTEIGALATRFRARAAVVDATVAHQHGAAEVGELGYSLAVGAQYLRALTAQGQPVESALALLEFRYAATVDQYLTIAKLRAARRLWSRVAELSGATPAAGTQIQHAATSLPMMTRCDPWTNLLRTTVAAFAAGVAGADSVTVLPFDVAVGRPDGLSRRLARNISSLLQQESRVAMTVDPAGGSCAIEALTADLVTAGWAEFQRIERSGGIAGALMDRSMLRRWTATAAERRSRIATGTQPVVGVNTFPLLSEPKLSRRPVGAGRLPGWAEDFEALRDEPATPSVFLATLGATAEHTGRAAVARNALAAGGIGTFEAGPNASVNEMMLHYDGSAVAALVGTDAAYDADGPAAIWALRSAGVRWVILVGRAAPALAQLVDDQLVAAADLPAFARRTREQLNGGM